MTITRILCSEKHMFGYKNYPSWSSFYQCRNFCNPKTHFTVFCFNWQKFTIVYSFSERLSYWWRVEKSYSASSCWCRGIIWPWLFADVALLCTIPPQTISDAILALIACFYIFNIQYKEGNNILSFLENILLGIGGKPRLAVSQYLNPLTG